ncbi:scyllo-inositol 2-dehydrogenase (NADP(+)) IolU [Emticicia aquatica]|jgi:predicted dehydrogenase|uniref:Scyllo-inositol 2-dehydrogenase (NADP(+)) IolU n=1 Tax=Emticicia aquatica TaxID=1681835 RepID=A0ABN8EUT9_9BACT|nr:Gfo/Idh/MocA family oxidoreductase [Emticicia aquatica]CAH0996805.1 scyllo-inositol 2-dehydrogenase (NADP(+)) IolU [Emticicia aquatica]
MKKNIKWGIIGVGKIAEKFATDLSAVKNAQLHAVASSTSLERAKEFAIRYNAPYSYDSYESIFETPDLDAIYIATPHILHAENTLLCLKHKIPVLCEKPFAMNLKQVQKMIESARENDTFLMEAMWTRFIPAIQKTLDLIAEDKIGKVKTIHADFGFVAPFAPEKRLLNPNLGGGALLDIGIYPAYLSLLFLGYPTHIQAISNFGETGIDEATSFVLGYKNNATAVLNCTLKSRTRTEAFIYGEKGYIHIEGRFMEAKRITLYEGENKPVKFSFPRKTFGYNFEIEEVNECLREGRKESEKMPLSMSVKLISLLDEIRQKAGIIYEGID